MQSPEYHDLSHNLDFLKVELITALTKLEEHSPSLLGVAEEILARLDQKRSLLRKIERKILENKSFSTINKDNLISKVRESKALCIKILEILKIHQVYLTDEFF